MLNPIKSACDKAFPAWDWKGGWGSGQATTEFGGDGRLYLQVTGAKDANFKATLYQARGRRKVAEAEGSTVGGVVGAVLYDVSVTAVYGARQTKKVPL